MSTLRDLADGLWVIDHAFSMPGGIQLGLRTSIVRLPSGRLWLHSPGPLDADEQAALRSLGEVEAIVSPNLFHHFYLKDASAAFPGAKVYGPAGLAAKVEGLPALVELGEGAPQEWGDAIELRAVGGLPSLDEVVFLHRPTRTLLLGDVAFNVQRGNFQTSLFLRLNKAWRRFGPSRLMRSMVKDKAALRSAIVDVVERWDFDRVVVTHGDVIESGGKQAMRESFDWLLAKS